MFLVGAIGLVGVAMFFPKELVWLLGPQYHRVESLVIWVMLAALGNTFVGLLWSLNSTRGWVRRSWVTVPAIVTCQSVAAVMSDISTVKGAVLFGALPAFGAAPILLWLAYRGLCEEAASSSSGRCPAYLEPFEPSFQDR